MNDLQSVWEQELYNEIEYQRKDRLLHCFEGDRAFVGLSFMDDIEANHFYEKVQERINKRRERQKQFASAGPSRVPRVSRMPGHNDRENALPPSAVKTQTELNTKSSILPWLGVWCGAVECTLLGCAVLVLVLVLVGNLTGCYQAAHYWRSIRVVIIYYICISA